MSHDEPFPLDSFEHDEVDPEHFLPAVGRFVAGNGVSEIAGALQPNDLDRVDVISSVDATLNVGLDLRPRVHKAGDVMLRQVVGVFGVERRDFGRVAVVVAIFPLFADMPLLTSADFHCALPRATGSSTIKRIQRFITTSFDDG
jgi:hypothetical protein